MSSSQSSTRRRQIMIGLATLPLCATVARAQNEPILSPDDPLAKAMHYSPDASTVDKSKFPTAGKNADGSNHICSTCNLYKGPPTAEYAPCSIFPGKRVHGPGWCQVWQPRQA